MVVGFWGTGGGVVVDVGVAGGFSEDNMSTFRSDGINGDSWVEGGEGGIFCVRFYNPCL